MSVAARRARSNGGDIRRALRARLEARRSEIEAAALTRIAAIADPAEVADPAYADGLRRALPAAISFGIETIDSGEASRPPIPVELLGQARLAARNGIALDTVLRRYFAGYSLLGYFILEEAAHAGITDGAELKRLLGIHAGLFDRLLEAVGEEHARESSLAAPLTAERRYAERIERLLAGEQVDTRPIPYDFEGWHVGLAAVGPRAERTVRDLAAGFDCRLLCIFRPDDTVWAWLGARRALDPTELLRALGPEASDESDQPPPAIALGEPAESLSGWRFTHRQAAAALPVARRGPKGVVRYAEVALLATALQDDLLTASLRRAYLRPLEVGRGDGATLRETLRAYVIAGRNLTSAAAALGVNRSTVTYRLQAIEGLLGRPVASCMADLEVVFALERGSGSTSTRLAANRRNSTSNSTD